MLTIGVLGSPSSCRGGHKKGSEEPLAALALGKVQFLASWTGGVGLVFGRDLSGDKGKVGWWAELPRKARLHPAQALTIWTGLMARGLGQR